MNWTEIASAAATLFLIMDPIGSAPVFNSILSRLTPARRTKVLVRELLIALGILAAFLLAGNVVLPFLGLTQPSLSIAGGSLLFIISLRMIFPSSEQSSDVDYEEPFIVPLATPLIAGPSSIAVLLLLSSTRPELMMEWGVALVLAWLGTAVLLLCSPWLLKWIGVKGARALERLMGMVLTILATQMLLNGVSEFVRTL